MRIAALTLLSCFLFISCDPSYSPPSQQDQGNIQQTYKAQ